MKTTATCNKTTVMWRVTVAIERGGTLYVSRVGGCEERFGAYLDECVLAGLLGLSGGRSSISERFDSGKPVYLQVTVEEKEAPDAGGPADAGQPGPAPSA